MANLQQSFRHGYSTSGTAGTGLGAVGRLASDFDVYSLPGRGTVVSARVTGGRERSEIRQTQRWVAAKPVAGEIVSGDAWAARFEGGFVLLVVADGLGHGPIAAEASGEAVLLLREVFRTIPRGVAPADSSRAAGHAWRRGSRRRIDFDQKRVRFAGLGNIACVVIGLTSQDAPKLQSMVSHNGTAGHEARQIKEFTYPFGSSEDIIVMHPTDFPAIGIWRAAPACFANIRR